MANTTAVPTLLTDPGYLFWAPIGSSVPTSTVVGSVFTDSWPVAWISLGATADGSTFTAETTVESLSVAEFFDPIAYRTTGRSGNFAFALSSITLSNLKKVQNGGTLTVTGSTTTTMTKFTPVAPGSEVRSMIGWESLDATLRIVGYQCFQGGSIGMDFKKAAADTFTTFAAQFNLEVPSSGVPYEMWSAGVARG